MNSTVSEFYEKAQNDPLFKGELEHLSFRNDLSANQKQSKLNKLLKSTAKRYGLGDLDINKLLSISEGKQSLSLDELEDISGGIGAVAKSISVLMASIALTGATEKSFKNNVFAETSGISYQQQVETNKEDELNKQINELKKKVEDSEAEKKKLIEENKNQQSKESLLDRILRVKAGLRKQKSAETKELSQRDNKENDLGNETVTKQLQTLKDDDSRIRSSNNNFQNENTTFNKSNTQQQSRVETSTQKDVVTTTENNQDLQEANKNLEEENKALQNRIKELEKNNAKETKSSDEEVTKQLQALKDENEKLKAENQTLNNEVEDIQKENADLKKENENLKSENNSLREENKKLKDQSATTSAESSESVSPDVPVPPPPPPPPPPPVSAERKLVDKTSTTSKEESKSDNKDSQKTDRGFSAEDLQNVKLKKVESADNSQASQPTADDLKIQLKKVAKDDKVPEGFIKKADGTLVKIDQGADSSKTVTMDELLKKMASIRDAVEESEEVSDESENQSESTEW